MFRTTGSFLLVSTLLFASPTILRSAAQPEPARALVQQGVAQASAANKVLFIHFSASW